MVVGEDPDPGIGGDPFPTLRVPRLGRAKAFLRCTLYPRRLEVEPIALDGPNPKPLSQEIPDPRVR